jgi:adenosylcobyric acid synthase
MLGTEILDPHGVESPQSEARGLGLISASTRLTRDKITREVQARTPSGIRFSGYEIHMGITLIEQNAPRPFAVLNDGSADGIRQPHAIGTYLHGALENQAVLEELLGYALRDPGPNDKDVQYDRLAGWFSENVRQDVFFAEYMKNTSESLQRTDSFVLNYDPRQKR